MSWTPCPVTLVMYDAFGRGGVARAVLSLASRLVDHRPVTVVSLFRGAPVARFPLDPRVQLEVLLDAHPARPATLPGWLRLLHTRPTGLRPEPLERHFSALTDRVLRRRLGRAHGTVVTTRPSLHLAAARWCPPETRLVGQDHKNFPTRFAHPRQADLLREAVPALDRFVVLTHADAADYRRELAATAPETRVQVIPNALPWPAATAPAPGDSRVIVAAGRLVEEKGMQRLVDAFAPVARQHPDWQLHVYGEGPQRAVLLDLVRTRALAEQVEFPGHTDDLRSRLGEAAVFAMASRSEGFPMVLLEALAAGLPLVAFDCPRGPGEIVVDGKNGFLVADGDQRGFSEALARLVEDDELRRACGRTALNDAAHYAPGTVLDEWLALLDTLDG